MIVGVLLKENGGLTMICIHINQHQLHKLATIFEIFEHVTLLLWYMDNAC